MVHILSLVILFHYPSVFTFKCRTWKDDTLLSSSDSKGQSANTIGCYRREKFTFFSWYCCLTSPCNYRRKTTWHYAHLHASVRIYC